MPHIFDYSASGSGLYDSQLNQLSELFMMRDGASLSADFWNGLGYLTSPISFRVPTGGIDDSGNPIYGVQTQIFGVDNRGTFSFNADDPVNAQFYARDPGLIAPPGFFDGATQMSYLGGSAGWGVSSNFLMRFEGLPAITRSFGSGPTGVFADYRAAQLAALDFMTVANARYLSDLGSMEARSLTDVSGIVLENWLNENLAERLHLMFTPDGNTHLTVGDIVSAGGASGTGNNPYISAVSGTSRMFDGEDVTVILSAFDDHFGDSTGGFAAHTLQIDAGNGADLITINGGVLAGSITQRFARNVIVNGEGGDDHIAVTSLETAVVSGGTGNDEILVSAAAPGIMTEVTLFGDDGDDLLTTTADIGGRLYGGAGNDELFSYAASDSLYGGDGNDRLTDAVVHIPGTDLVRLFTEANLFDGGGGDDTLTGGGGDDTLIGGAGNDQLTGFLGNDQLIGGAGLDVYFLTGPDRRESNRFITFGNDVITDDGGIIIVSASGFPSQSISYARAGNDLVFGDIGLSAHRVVDFYLHTSTWFNGFVNGDGSIVASRTGFIDWDFAASLPGPGVQLSGTSGPDLLVGTNWNDTLFGSDGADTLNGLSGDDVLIGGTSASDLRDVIYGGDGNDSIDGGTGNDELNGGNGNDTVIGGIGSDTVIGNDGNDTLAGGSGSDLMFGNAGDDYINGGFGSDRLNGGAGADSFYHAGVPDHGSDWIQDYSAAEGDVLVINISPSSLQVNFATTPGAGAADIAEAFIIYRPTGQILFALVDGADDAHINVQVGINVFDLLA